MGRRSKGMLSFVLADFTMINLVHKKRHQKKGGGRGASYERESLLAAAC